MALHIYHYILHLFLTIHIDCKDDLSTSSKEHHKMHMSPEHGRSSPANSTEGNDFQIERIVNPSYLPFEMCHEKVTYSNL